MAVSGCIKLVGEPDEHGTEAEEARGSQGCEDLEGDSGILPVFDLQYMHGSVVLVDDAF